MDIIIYYEYTNT